MANVVTNRLVVVGPPEELDAFAEAAKGDASLGWGPTAHETLVRAMAPHVEDGRIDPATVERVATDTVRATSERFTVMAGERIPDAVTSAASAALLREMVEIGRRWIANPDAAVDAVGAALPERAPEPSALDLRRLLDPHPLLLASGYGHREATAAVFGTKWVTPARRSPRTTTAGVGVEEYTFDSADSAPAPAVAAVAERFDGLAFVHAHVDPDRDDGAVCVHVRGEFDGDDVVDPAAVDPLGGLDEDGGSPSDQWHARVDELLGRFVDRTVADMSRPPAPAWP